MCPDKSREKKNKSRCPKKTYTHTRTYYTDTLWRAYDVVVVHVYDYDETVHIREKDTKELTITIVYEPR
jgi:hypothetical protein